MPVYSAIIGLYNDHRIIFEEIRKDKTLLGILLAGHTYTVYNFDSNFNTSLPFREDWEKKSKFEKKIL